jgi:hypothetical protein
MQTTRESEQEHTPMDLLINYREKFNENDILKNYKIGQHIDFYYMDETLINAVARQNREVEEQVIAEPEDAEPEDVEPEQTSQEVQTFCIYDEVCSEKKMCGDCALDYYERTHYEEEWENFKMDRRIDYNE